MYSEDVMLLLVVWTSEREFFRKLLVVWTSEREFYKKRGFWAEMQSVTFFLLLLKIILLTE